MLQKLLTTITVIAFAFTVVPAAKAMAIDITNDVNRDFILGYKYEYNENCVVTWWASPSGGEFLMTPDECKGISEKRVYRDMLKQIEYVKASSNAENFSSFYRMGGKNKIDEDNFRIHQFCINSDSLTYLFLNAPAQNKPGWNYVDTITISGGRLRGGVVGFWKSTGPDSAVVDYGHGVKAVDMSKAFQCK